MSGYTFKKLSKQGHMGVIDNAEDIKKILLNMSGNAAGENINIGIDMETKAVYYNVNPVLMGIEEPTKYLDDDHLKLVKDIMIYYNINDWQQFYEEQGNSEVIDGFGWSLVIEGKDMLVEKHLGAGMKKSEVTPPGFDEFTKIVLKLAESTH
ncbi:MAG: hypothetical protein E7262_08415 [Lachnospiraceae bacterium]|nr:hypothetical protein [Lachnospiraceae bacterium]